MSKITLVFAFLAWAATNLIAFGYVFFSDRPSQVRLAERVLKTSQRLLVIVVALLIAEVWWQEDVMRFAASPTQDLTVTIQDHGTKYVTARDARITELFGTAFYLFFIPFISFFVGELGRTEINGDQDPQK